MEASSSRIRCGKIATLSTDRVVVARPHYAVSVPQIPPQRYSKYLTVNGLFDQLRIKGGVAGGLLSSARLSQRSSERS